MTQNDLFAAQRPGLGPVGLAAYVATPITHASAEASERIDAAVEAIETHLRQRLRFEEVHVPKYYTSPQKRPDMLGREVARVDKDRLVGSDLLIFLGEEPSTGSGMEVAWSVDAGLYLLIAVSEVTLHRPSRIAVGSSDRAKEVIYNGHEELLGQVDAFVNSNSEALERHRKWRQLAPDVLGPFMEQLKMLASGVRGNDQIPETDALLLDLCGDSPAHCAGLTIGEYVRLELAAGRRTFESVTNAYGDGFASELLAGISRLPELADLSGAEVVALLRDVEREFAGADTRANFNEPSFWRARRKGAR